MDKTNNEKWKGIIMDKIILIKTDRIISGNVHEIKKKFIHVTNRKSELKAQKKINKLIKNKETFSISTYPVLISKDFIYEPDSKEYKHHQEMIESFVNELKDEYKELMTINEQVKQLRDKIND